MRKIRWVAMLLFILLATPLWAAKTTQKEPVEKKQPRLNETLAGPGDWGYRPCEGARSEVNPPSFSWRPQRGLVWEIQCASDGDFRKIYYKAKGLEFNVHCPPRTFAPGAYAWRYRGRAPNGKLSKWSRERAFTIAPDAAPMPMPPREELLGRVPKSHPRLFLRPENLGALRKAANGMMRKERNDLIRSSERLLSRPPSTEEPPKYPRGMTRGSDPWRSMWWGNRKRAQAALGSAATLGFTRLITGREEFGREAKRLLMECAKWDPKGSTGFRYNDEAGMPYAYYFSRTYTFIYDLLSEEEREVCRGVMRLRGEEMYRHLNPQHLWRPYGSHNNRAWHFLGEVGIAFLGEIEGADDWLWFATNVFFNVYPVWGDDDGGWHEGSSYWSSYQQRFTWWADVMREALDIDAYDKPYYSKAGYFAMYLMPPGKVGGGFGDLTAYKESSDYRSIMTTLAVQSRNPHWQWWIEANGGVAPERGYIGFIRGALPKVDARPPSDIPNSRLFRGTGLAFLNSNLSDATQGVQVSLKSSPFGTQSHGYESNNSFLLSAYGKRLLIRSGRRDSYGSNHHKNWMWTTRSTNCVTVGGQGQKSHSSATRGDIVAFETSPSMDLVAGEAAGAYGSPKRRDFRGNVVEWEPLLNQFKRTILFVKPELIVVYDRLEACEPSTFTYWLHAVNEIDIQQDQSLLVRNDGVLCDIDFLAPKGLALSQTDQYDPNPRERVSLREWHLTAETAKKSKRMEFVTLYRPRRSGEKAVGEASLERVDGGYFLRANLAKGGGRVEASLPVDGATQARLIRPDGSIETIGGKQTLVAQPLRRSVSAEPCLNIFFRR